MCFALFSAAVSSIRVRRPRHRSPNAPWPSHRCRVVRPHRRRAPWHRTAVERRRCGPHAHRYRPTTVAVSSNAGSSVKSGIGFSQTCNAAEVRLSAGVTERRLPVPPIRTARLKTIAYGHSTSLESSNRSRTTRPIRPPHCSYFGRARLFISVSSCRNVAGPKYPWGTKPLCSWNSLVSLGIDKIRFSRSPLRALSSNFTSEYSLITSVAQSHTGAESGVRSSPRIPTAGSMYFAPRSRSFSAANRY